MYDASSEARNSARGDLLCLAHSRERYELLSYARHFSGLHSGLGVNRCLDRAGSDCVDAYATGRKLAGERSSERAGPA
jgi:hypothetical protein